MRSEEVNLSYRLAVSRSRIFIYNLIQFVLFSHANQAGYPHPATSLAVCIFRRFVIFFNQFQLKMRVATSRVKAFPMPSRTLHFE